VIYQLKKRCGELTEEELGKLSVQLLNCQSEVEHRPVYTCTLDMTLAECTKDMDAVTWNTYQITGQEHLHSMTQDTVRRLFESQQELLVTHETLKAKQTDVIASVADNVIELQKEKALIAAGNQQLAQLAEKIRAELIPHPVADFADSTAKLIKTQGSEQQAKHEDILKDLKRIHEQATEALSRLDTSTQELLSHQGELQKQQQEVFENLQKINKTVVEVMGAIVGLQSLFEGRIAWVTQLLGGADDKLVVLQCCVLHVAYFLLLVVVAAFLHTPVVTRILLMVVVVANMAGQLAHKSSLDFAGLTVFMVAIVLSHWVLRQVAAVVRRRQHGQVGGVRGAAAIMFSSSTDGSPPLTSEEVRNLTSLLQRLSCTVRESLHAEPVANGSVPRSPVTTPTSSPVHSNHVSPVTTLHEPGPSGDTLGDLMRVRQRLMTSADGHSNRSSRASTPSHARLSRGSTPSVSSRCLGRTLVGGQCRLSATPGSDFCRRHVPG
ncbi:hypothetical protein BaRGS_00026217, partial [Batillaria attramentaria]